MRTLDSSEFINTHGDHVSVKLIQDSALGLHLITKVKSMRKQEVQRFNGNTIVKFEETTWLEETKLAAFMPQLFNTAQIEFRLECLLHGMPDYTHKEFEATIEQFRED